MVNCPAPVLMKEHLSMLVVKNGLLAICCGFLAASTSCLLFGFQVLPGFTRFHWGGPQWSTYCLAAGVLGSLMGFLWRPCIRGQELATLEEVTEVEKQQPDPLESVNPWMGLASITSFITILAAVIPVTLAPVEDTLLPLISYLLLLCCVFSFAAALALRKHQAAAPAWEGSFSRRWTIAVSSPFCWAFMDVAVSLFRAQWFAVAWEYVIYGSIIWLLVAPSMWIYFLWLATRLPSGSSVCRELMTTALMVLLAAPPVLAACACFLLAREWGPTPLMHAVIFSGMMLVCCLLPQLIVACRNRSLRRGSAAAPGANRGEAKGKQAERL